MTTAPGSARRRAVRARRPAIRFALAGACLAAACHPQEGTSGVHVTLDVLPNAGWSSSDAFDHVTLVARSGSRTSTICLSAQQGPAAAIAVDAAISPDGAAGDPCADLTELAWSQVPTVATWAFGASPGKSVNFDVAAGDTVSVTAAAYLGGSRQPIGTARGEATSALPLPTLALLLVKQSQPSCGVSFSPNDVPDAGPSDAGIACQTTSTCLCGDCLGIAPDVTCLDASALVDPLDAPACAFNAAARLQTNDLQPGECVVVTAVGHFFGCKEGDPKVHVPDGTCTVTTDCTPPEAGVVLRGHKGDGYKEFARSDLSCLPPFAFPVPLGVKLEPGDGGGGLLPLLELDVSPSGDPSTCALEYHVTNVVQACASLGP